MAAEAQYPFHSALVTGASSGIGEAMVELLAAAGVPTLAVARREDRLGALADRCPGVEVLAADLTSPEGLAAAAERAADADLVVNNAGFGTSGRFHELEAERLQREIALNATAVTRLSHAALAGMMSRGRGYLLNVSSVVSFQPAPGLAVYAATKAFVTSLGESLHEEARGTGVHVTTLCPGLTRTEFISVSNSSGYQEQYPEVAWLTAEQVAAVGLRDVARGRALSVPGVLYKTMAAATGVLPRRVARRLSGLVQRT